MASDVTSKFRRGRSRETSETCKNPSNSHEFGYNLNWEPMHIDCATTGDIGDLRFVTLNNRQTIFRVFAVVVVVVFLEHVFAWGSKGRDA